MKLNNDRFLLKVNSEGSGLTAPTKIQQPVFFKF
ncbi:hypothetical protein J2T02_002216 [Chitinophaga terrae (ex Kim and Jung 2007)]|jgi:hypothetical protein|nr:hypothetical protein [Chitinophaga terrae (ex Kim and Jung 2007)]